MTVKARAEISLVGVSDGAKGDKGDTGAAGNGIKSTAITYQASTSNTTAPTGTWSSTIPSVAAGSYLWTKTVITYTNGTTSTSYSVAKQGATGATGAAGADGKMLYGTCATAAGTAAKVATATGFKLVSGTSVSVKFTYTNTAASPTLNVNSLGAKAIYTNGTRYAYWAAGSTVTFVYDGTNFQVTSVPVYANTATVGNPASGNVYIDNDSVDIRQGSTVNATFSNDEIELGKNSTNSQISMCGGVGTIRAIGNSSAAPGFDKALAIQSGVLGLDGQSITIGTSSQYETDEDNAHKSFCDIHTYAYKEEDDSHWAAFSLRTEDWNSGNFANISAEANEITYSGENAVQATSGLLQFSAGGESSISTMTLESDHAIFATDDAVFFTNPDNNSSKFGAAVNAEDGSYGLYSYVKSNGSSAAHWMIRDTGTDLELGSSHGRYKPYYTKGESVTLGLAIAGYCTNSAKDVYFHWSPSKPLLGVSSISVASVDGLTVRVEGKYAYGSSSSARVKPSSYKASSSGNTVKIIATFSNTTNVTTNKSLGIDASIKVTFN